jgi:co-chaperonin GroES (HSP10)
MSKFKAVNDFLVIEPIHEEMVSSSGMVFSTQDIKDVRYAKAKVFMCSIEIPTDIVKDGDVVYYDKAAEQKVIIDGTKYSLVRRRDLVAVE